jgi:hypothetical protein
VVVWLAAYRTAFLHAGRLAPVGAERQLSRSNRTGLVEARLAPEMAMTGFSLPP